MFASLFSGGAASLVKAVGDVADNLITSDEERAAGALAAYKAETERIEVENRHALAQVRVNEEASRHASLFVAGARPSIIWICALAMLYHFIIFPIAGPMIEKAAGVELVDIAWEELSVILLGILGIGGMRTFEKVRGVARDNFKK